MVEEIKHRENDRRGMFYIENEKGIMSELTYSHEKNGILIIDHTQTKPEYEGQGLASKLVERTVLFARENRYKIDPLCPFTEVQFDLHQEYKDVRLS